MLGSTQQLINVQYICDWPNPSTVRLAAVFVTITIEFELLASSTLRVFVCVNAISEINLVKINN